MSKCPVEQARLLLKAAGVFFYDDASQLDEDDSVDMLQTINTSDTWGWACADAEYVPDEHLPEVARLYHDYGWCGILYWASERHEQMTSEFHDINRFIEFVRNEEAIKKTIPDYNARAYAERQYTVGIPPN